MSSSVRLLSVCRLSVACNVGAPYSAPDYTVNCLGIHAFFHRSVAVVTLHCSRQKTVLPAPRQSGGELSELPGATLEAWSVWLPLLNMMMMMNSVSKLRNIAIKHHCILFRVLTSDIVCCLHSVQMHYVCFMRNFSNIHCVYSITVVISATFVVFIA